MKWETLRLDYEALSASRREHLPRRDPRDPRIVLGLPTGRTPIGMYERVVAECSREYHCFRDVVDVQSRRVRRHPVRASRQLLHVHEQHLFDHVDLDPAQRAHPGWRRRPISTPSARATSTRSPPPAASASPSSASARNGHIGFNEPGTPFDSRTRVVDADANRRAPPTRRSSPTATCRRTRSPWASARSSSRSRIVLLASGDKKRAAIERLRSGEIGEEFPASALWKHRDVTVSDRVV